MPPHREKPRSLEPRKKRIKKRKDKNLLKRCLVSGAPRQRIRTAEQKNSLSVQLQSSEHSQKCLMETRPSRPCISEKEEELVPSPLHSCETVKKEELPSRPATCDMASGTLCNNALAFAVPDKNQSVEEKVNDIAYGNIDANERSTVENQSSPSSLFKNNALENFNHEMNDIQAPVTKTNSQGHIDSLLISVPFTQVISQQSEQHDRSKVWSSNNDSDESFTNDLLISHSLTHLENLFA